MNSTLGKNGFFIKRICYLTLSLFSILILFTACTCGGDMKGWPSLELNLDIDSFNEVALEYNRLPYGRSKDEEHFYGSSTDKEVINDIYFAVDGMLYSEKIYSKIDTEKYCDNVIIKFLKDDEVFVFKYYSYGIKKGYFVFDNGEIHKHCGNFVGIYENFKDKLS